MLNKKVLINIFEKLLEEAKNSYDELESLLKNAESILQKLNLHIE